MQSRLVGKWLDRLHGRRRNMPRRPASVTQADIARAIRAAKHAGAGAVEVRPSGTIVIILSPQPALDLSGAPERAVDGEAEIVL